MWSFLCGGKQLLSTGLLVGMTDLHSHALPGVDDGARTVEDSLNILNYLEELGVSELFLTPHVMVDFKNNTANYLTKQFEALKPNVPKGVAVRLAAEYMLDTGYLEHLKEGLLSYDGKHVLLETSYVAGPPNLFAMIYETLMSGYQPVLAHPERYRYMDREMHRALKRQRCKFQLNILSLSGYYGKRAKHYAQELLEQGMYDFVGSDIHNMRHKKAYEDFRLNAKTIAALRKLLENNKRLWK